MPIQTFVSATEGLRLTREELVLELGATAFDFVQRISDEHHLGVLIQIDLLLIRWLPTESP